MSVKGFRVRKTSEYKYFAKFSWFPRIRETLVPFLVKKYEYLYLLENGEDTSKVMGIMPLLFDELYTDLKRGIHLGWYREVDFWHYVEVAKEGL